MKMYEGKADWLHTFLISALDRGKRSASHPDYFTPGGRAPGTHWTGNWVGLGIGLDAVRKRKKSLILPGIEPWSSRP